MNNSSLDAHIDGCGACQAALDDLVAEDSVTANPGALRVPGAKHLPRIPGLEIEHELGRGGMGVVYLARERNPDRPVAVKFLPSGPFAAQRDRDRWLKEARAAARVRHPRIVQLHRVDEADGWLYFVLEYLPGRSLKERLTGPLPPRIAAGLLVPIVQALEELHCAGVWHLDLKPANILIDAEPGTPLDRAALKLTDFGIARSRDEADLTCPSRCAAPGTPLYMAPEQVAGLHSSLGPATDIHAVGIILYELLTGRPPFLAESNVETMRRVQTENPLPPRRLNSRVPRDLETICLKCLAKEPRRRYPSAGALAEDLQRWLTGHPISARPVSSIETIWRWCQRRPVASSLAAGLAFTLLASFLCFLFLWRYAEAERARAEGERVKSEADYEVSRAALAEVVEIGAASLEPTVVITRGRAIASLRAARPQIGKLHQRRPDDGAIWRLLASVDLFLGRNFEYQNGWSEAEACFHESLMRWDKLVKEVPTEFAPAYRRWQTLVCLGRVLEQQGKEAESIRIFERATEAGETVLTAWPYPESDFGTLMDSRLHLATLVERQGDPQRAATLLEANLQLWRGMPEKARTPVIAARVEKCRGELYRILCESGAVSAENWAQGAVKLLCSLANVQSGDTADVSETGYTLQRLLSERASYLRRSGDVDRAKRIVERMHRFGCLLVSRYPERSAAHLAYCEAFCQSAKEGFQVDDCGAVEQNWKRGLDEVRQALLSDPGDARARKVVDILKQKLRRLEGSPQKMGFKR
jgi:tetratricopeptide (TPR) repeat protein